MVGNILAVGPFLGLPAGVVPVFRLSTVDGRPTHVQICVGFCLVDRLYPRIETFSRRHFFRHGVARRVKFG